MSGKRINLLKIITIYMFVAIVFYFVAGDQLRYSESERVMPEVSDALIIHDGTVVEQAFKADLDIIRGLDFFVVFPEDGSQAELRIQILAGTDILAEATVSQADYTLDAPFHVEFGEPVNVEPEQTYVIRFAASFSGGNTGEFYYLVNDELSDADGILADSEFVRGKLCIQMQGGNENLLGRYYLQFALAGLILVVVYCIWCNWRTSHQKPTMVSAGAAVWERYKFLIQQLVIRDFKVKYKRSVLGYCWSFLNPLLTMLVQYVVFSQLFRSGIENFPVYLLSGNIMFSFFTDSVGQGLNSITGNASLITKVYVPKYIYPATKVFSSSINLFISMIPLLLVTLLTGGKINQTLLLLGYVILCLLAYCMGIVLLLSAVNVFFRDVQYLWGIISLIWMYATPIFYPAEIIPEQFRLIQTLNPMYHFIVFVRAILIEGVSPRPLTYVACLISALVSLGAGAAVFKRLQGKFALYI